MRVRRDLAVLYTLTITGQIFGTHSYPLRASTIKRSRDVKAMMTAAAISARAFVSIYREYTVVCWKGIPGQSFLTKIQSFKDVRAHWYCASLLRTLYMTCVYHVMYFKRAHRVETQQNTELMTFTVTQSPNVFVGCSVTLTFFAADNLLFWFLPLY